MKYFLVAAFVAVLGSALSVPVEDGSGDRVLDLLNAIDNYVVKFESAIDPVKFPDISRRRIFDPIQQINLMFASSNGKLHDFSKTKIINVATDPQRLTATFTVMSPLMALDGDYTMDGIYWGRKVSGNGQLSVQTINASVTYTVQLAEDKYTKAISVASLSEKLNLGAVVTKFGNLKLDGLTEEQLEQFLDEKSVAIFNKIKPLMEILNAKGAKDSVNLVIYGKTMDEVIEWLQEHTPTSSEAEEFLRSFYNNFIDAVGLSQS